MTVRAANDILPVAVSFASLDHLTWSTTVIHLVHMHFDNTIPTSRDNSVIITTIGNERDFNVTTVGFKFLSHNSGL